MTEIDMCEELKSMIEGFQATVDDSTITVERTYNKSSELKENRVDVAVYPLARLKQREGNATKRLTPMIYVSITTKCPPGNRSRLDKLIKYVFDLDEFLEGKPVCGAKYVFHEETQFVWFPEQLHDNNRFISLIPLQYQSRSLIGPTT